jgi:hypothetical protein
MKKIVAFSGGKDSTAMALRMAELGEPFKLLHTATGNELPGVREHLEKVVRATGAELIDLKAPTLGELIDEQGCLPNWRMRWCTRMIKIEPVSRWIAVQGDVTLCVGLRADEEGRAGGTYDCEVSYPLRDWKWGLDQVVGYCKNRGFTPPKRTDCAICFYQTIFEWHQLWLNHPTYWTEGEAWEEQTGYTFRSPGRDTWPAAMKDLAKSFASGRVPKERKRKVSCRVCTP